MHIANSTKIAWQYKINEYNESTTSKEEWLIGLDNGVVIKKNDKTEAIEGRLCDIFEDDGSEYSVTYYRKCYNIRNEILYIINHRFDEEYEYSLDLEDIEQIIEYLSSLNADNWEDSGSSIWDWKEMEDHIKQDVENLEMLVELMQDHDMDVVFYDSY